MHSMQYDFNLSHFDLMLARITVYIIDNFCMEFLYNYYIIHRYIYNYISAIIINCNIQICMHVPVLCIIKIIPHLLEISYTKYV